MQELTRKELYSNMVSNIENIIDLNFEDIENWRTITSIYEINIILLNNIEEKFFDFKFDNNEKADIIQILYTNLDNLKSEISRRNISIEDKKIDKISKNLYAFIDKAVNTKLKPTNIFNGVLKILNDWSGEILKEYMYFLKELAQRKKKLNFKKIFLSYAYEDNLYTFALFYYMYSKNLYLYVDWLHNDKIPNVHQLKTSLHDNLKSSDQLLFLQSSNMELYIAGNPSIKSWCAWELGNFYHKNIAQNLHQSSETNVLKGHLKFYISIYKSHSNKKHMILEGLKELTSISATGLT